MLLLNESLCTVRASGRWLKADVAARVTDAAALLESAQTALRAKADAAAAEFARARKEGYADGKAQAAVAFAEASAQWQIENRRLQRQRAAELLQIVQEVLRYYFAHQGDETLICALVNRAWEAFGRRHLPLLVRVPSGKGAAIQAQLRTWAQRLAPAEEVDVQELHTLPEGCCEVVSPLGRMRLSLETQLEAFAKAFETALEQEEETP